MLKERFLTDERGERIAVVLDVAEYRRVLQELEELASIRAYDEAKASGEAPVPFDRAIAELDRRR